MSRLIDADKLIEAHYNACNEDPNKSFYTWSLELMKNAPTAYDVDKVVEELEGAVYPYELCYADETEVDESLLELEMVKSIVRRGGTDITRK